MRPVNMSEGNAHWFVFSFATETGMFQLIIEKLITKVTLTIHRLTGNCENKSYGGGGADSVGD